MLHQVTGQQEGVGGVHQQVTFPWASRWGRHIFPSSFLYPCTSEQWGFLDEDLFCALTTTAHSLKMFYSQAENCSGKQEALFLGISTFVQMMFAWESGQTFVSC